MPAPKKNCSISSRWVCRRLPKKILRSTRQGGVLRSGELYLGTGHSKYLENPAILTQLQRLRYWGLRQGCRLLLLQWWWWCGCPSRRPSRSSSVSLPSSLLLWAVVEVRPHHVLVVVVEPFTAPPPTPIYITGGYLKKKKKKKKKKQTVEIRARAKVHPSSRDFWGFW